MLNEYTNSNFTEIEYLILMSCFKNFIISNSTYYWWAAYLAESIRKINIISSTKFKNFDTVPKRWKKNKNLKVNKFFKTLKDMKF